MKYATKISFVVISILLALGCQNTPPRTTTSLLQEGENEPSDTTISLLGDPNQHEDGETPGARLAPSEEYRRIRAMKDRYIELAKRVKSIGNDYEEIMIETESLYWSMDYKPGRLNPILEETAQTISILVGMIRRIESCMLGFRVDRYGESDVPQSLSAGREPQSSSEEHRKIMEMKDRYIELATRVKSIETDNEATMEATSELCQRPSGTRIISRRMEILQDEISDVARRIEMWMSRFGVDRYNVIKEEQNIEIGIGDTQGNAGIDPGTVFDDVEPRAQPIEADTGPSDDRRLGTTKPK